MEGMSSKSGVTFQVYMISFHSHMRLSFGAVLVAHVELIDLDVCPTIRTRSKCEELCLLYMYYRRAKAYPSMSLLLEPHEPNPVSVNASRATRLSTDAGRCTDAVIAHVT